MNEKWTSVCISAANHLSGALQEHEREGGTIIGLPPTPLVCAVKICVSVKKRAGEGELQPAECRRFDKCEKLQDSRKHMKRDSGEQESKKF